MPLPDSLGKYTIQRELGRGAMGVVYRGFDPFIEREVAIKTLRTDGVEAKELPALLERFKKEAQAAGRLNHPSIVQIYEYGEDAGQVYIAMEIVQGVELRDYLEEGAKFGLDRVVAMMTELLDALGFAHRHGVVHRDIKPGNIVVLPDGRIKIMDFGIARLESSTLTQAGTVLGTPSYMSPEQFMGQRVDGRSDLFSAGAILYELLTGEKAFPGNAFSTIMHKVLKDQPVPPSELNVLVSPAFDAVVRKALGKRPDERFQTAAEFVQALKRALAGEAPLAEGGGDGTLVVGDATMVASAADATMVARGPAADATVVATPGVAQPSRAAPADATLVAAADVGVPPGASVDTAHPASVPPPAPATPAAVSVSSRVGRNALLAAGAALVVLAGLWLGMRGDDAAIPQPVAEPVAQVPHDAGWLQVDSVPSGAVLTLDHGAFAGVTPTRLALPAGAHHLRARKEGFQDWEATIEIAAGEEIPLQLTLSPAP